MKFSAEVKTIFNPLLVWIDNVQILLHDEVIPQLLNGDETLETGIHVAVVSIIFQPNNALS